MPDPLSWDTATPASCGLDADRLEAAWQNLADHRTKAFLVTRRGRLVFERYAEGWSAGKPHYTASLAKALVGGLSLALAMDDGLISPDDLACQYVPEWRDDSLKSKITVRHLATHTAGIEDAELSLRDREDSVASGRTLTGHHMALPGWKGVFWRGTRRRGSEGEPDPVSLARDAAPVIFEPGSAYAYSNPGLGMLTYCVTAAFQGTPWPDVRTLLAERLFAPLGLRDEDWSIGYDKTFHVDGLPVVASWGGGSFTARAVARIGQLLLQDGAWEDRQLISPTIVHQLTAHAGTPLPDRGPAEIAPDCAQDSTSAEGTQGRGRLAACEALHPAPGSGLSWWTNYDRVWPAVPADAFAGAGAGNQILLVVPSLELVVVRNGSNLDRDDAGQRFWVGVVEHLFDPVMDSFSRRAPYPHSPVIAGVTWDPPGQVRRLALGGRRQDGSDNWPITWADDGHLYTAYGDGYGFEPQLPDKLSLGYGVVTGGPEDFVGLNIRSDGERLGSGPQGEKASGLLMVDGALYIWARNADGAGSTARLGWSADRARSWAWADWASPEFGHPAFVNFGRNYAGARDQYVYAVSHDHPSAYETADHFVLMRVPKDRIRDRSEYEFFVGRDERGEPVWSGSVADRGPVFANEAQCRRSSVSYNPGLRRYLWWQQLTTGDSDTRFEGGFGLYDAPEPWGPWTTVFFTDRWDVGPGDLGHFPTKWMSQDGRTCWMVFSGSDNFCVRRAVFQTAD